MLLFDVTQEFNRQIKEKLKGQQEKIDFIMNHERRQMFLDNVCAQVLAYEHRFGVRIERKGRDQIIDMATTMFITNAFKHHEDQQLTECARLAKEREKSEWDECQETLDEMERLGVEYGEESD